MSTKVFCHNLPFGFERRDIEDMLDDNRCPRMRDVDIMRSRGGEAKGMASIEFESHEEAEDAIKILNHLRIGGRQITCREDRGIGYVHPDTFNRNKGKGKGKRGDSRPRGGRDRRRDSRDRRDRRRSPSRRRSRRSPSGRRDRRSRGRSSSPQKRSRSRSERRSRSKSRNKSRSRSRARSDRGSD